MLNTKIVVDAQWIITNPNWAALSEDNKPEWRLMVYPMATQMNKGVFVLGDIDDSELPGVSAEKILGFVEKPEQSVTLHNLGHYCCQEGYTWELLVLIPTPNLKTNTVAKYSQYGYVDLEDIKPKDLEDNTEDDLDMWIYTQLKSLTGPKAVTCSGLVLKNNVLAMKDE